MNSANGAAVVVGVDGSEPALRAVRLAATEAVRRHRPLRVVHGFIWPLLRMPIDPVAGNPPGAGYASRRRTWSRPPWSRPARSTPTSG